MRIGNGSTEGKYEFSVWVKDLIALANVQVASKTRFLAPSC